MPTVGGATHYDPGDGTAGAIRIVNRDGSAISAGGGGGTSATDDAAFTPGASSTTPVGGIVTADSVDAGDVGAFAMLANRQQKITLYDSSGAEITSFGGGTQYVEDAVAAANPSGNAIIVVRDDGRVGSLTTNDGDNIALRGTNAGELYVKHVDALTVSSHAVTNAGTFAVQAAQSGTWTVQPGNTANTTAWKVDGSAVTQPVSGTVAVSSISTSIVPGTAATNLGKAEDAAHASGDVGVMALSVRQDTAAALAGTDADYQPLITDASGRLHVNVGNTVTVGSHAVTNAGTFAVQADTELTTADLDTGAGTDTRAVIGLVVPASGGAALVPGDGTKGLKVQITDGAGSQITSFGGGVEYAEDTAHTTGDTGKMVLAVRRDADTTLADTTGDYAPLQVNAAGSLKVAITAGAGSGGTSLADNAGFTPGTTSFTPIGGEVDDTATTAATENSGAAVRITAQRAFHVNLRDNSGNEVSVGGGTQYDEDSVHVSGDKVTMAGAVRSDTAAALSGTDGDRTVLITDASGRLHVNVGNTVTVGSHAVTNAGTFAVQSTIAAGATNIAKAEDVASADSDVGVPSMAVRKATPANTSGTDGDYEFLQMSAGRLWTSAVIDTALPAGTNNIGDVDVLTVPTDPFGANADAASATGSISAKLRFIAGTGIPITGTVTVGSHAVTNAGTFVTQENGAALTSLQLIDDTVTVLGTDTYTEATSKGLTIGAVRRDADTTLVNTTNEFGPLQMDANGRLKVEVFSGETLPISGTVTASNTTGNIAHDSADSGNPVKVGGKAVSAEPTAVTANDRANFITDLVGKLITLPYANPENFVSGAITSAMTGTTSTSLVAAPAAGLRNYITTIVCSNSHATVGTDIVIQDGSGGTTLMTIPAAAVYGGAVINLPVPLRQPTTATAIFCANVTTGASTKVSAVGYKGS